MRLGQKELLGTKGSSACCRTDTSWEPLLLVVALSVYKYAGGRAAVTASAGATSSGEVVEEGRPVPDSMGGLIVTVARSKCCFQ